LPEEHPTVNFMQPDITLALDRLEAKLRALRSWAQQTAPPPSFGVNHGFITAPPTREEELEQIEREYELSLPPQYRAFLRRFGDTDVGPGNCFFKVRAGLTAASKRKFPLADPFLGCCSPDHQWLSKAAQQERYKQLDEEWDRIPKEDGVLSISDYGCALYAKLILAGPFRDRVWFLSGDAAYYGPFGGSEALHDENAPGEWEPTAARRDYSFLEWYESWLEGQLKTAGLVAR
jgi:hypothetical protein